ncbi:hypothetical protein JNK62_00135 [bacterium]|nr:hypothetical protein [bacterium]
MTVDRDTFSRILRNVAQRDTSADPKHWTEHNPLWGHCAVASVLAQEYLGGKLMCGSLAHISKYAHLRSHYWNALADGTQIDFTKDQYSDLTFQQLEGEERDSGRVLSQPDTIRRYRLLKERFKNLV